MAIHRTRSNGHVISSHGRWLPGMFESKRAAQVAFQFTDEMLDWLMSMSSPSPITLNMLRDNWKHRTRRAPPALSSRARDENPRREHEGRED